MQHLQNNSIRHKCCLLNLSFIAKIELKKLDSFIACSHYFVYYTFLFLCKQ